MKDKESEALYKQYEEEIKARENAFKSGLNDKQQNFLNQVARAGYYGWSISSGYDMELLDGLSKGIYRKPSEFVKKKLNWLFDGYIYPRFREALYYAVDQCKNWPYSDSYYRRSFRKDTYYVTRILGIIRDFHKKLVIDYDMTDILSLNLPEKEKAYFLNCKSWMGAGFSAEAIAYFLDHDDKKLEDILTDIVNGDSETALHRDIILGIVRCDNERMHALLGRLLLAARLQEGLRQTICETMDMGNVSAFRYMLNIINDNNLIRYSSVKRAVGTWLGLIEPDTGNLERISEKSAEYITYCLSNTEHIKEYLATEDSLKIYIALWAMAVYNAGQAVDCIKELSKTGTHHQILTAGYFCANLDEADLAHELAKSVISGHSREYDILAVYMRYFIGDWNRYAAREEDHSHLTIENYFEDKKEAESYYDLMWQIYKDIPKKKLEFSPCIFNWYTASLTKSQLIVRLCLIAKMLGDNDKIDIVSRLIKDCDIDSRSACLTYTLCAPATKAQRETATDMLCDKESWTRTKAKNIVSNMHLEDENYLQMEAMLKYKAADMRSMLISFLMQQKADQLSGTVERLLMDKKEEKRTAGLDIVMQIASDPEKKTLLDQCIVYVKQLAQPSSKEQILIDNILGAESSANGASLQKALLYGPEDAYIPDIEETDFIRASIELFMVYFPDSQLQEKIQKNKEKAGIFEKLRQMAGGRDKKTCESAAGALADCDSLHALFTSHAEDEFRGYNGEIYTLGNCINHFREFITERETETPCLSLWKEWYEKNIGDVGRLYRMYVLLNAWSRAIIDYQEAMIPYLQTIFGAGFEVKPVYEFGIHLQSIVIRLLQDYMTYADKIQLAAALAYWYVKCLPQEMVLVKAVPPADSYHLEQEAHFIAHGQLNQIFADLACKNDGYFHEIFPLSVKVCQKTFIRAAKTRLSNNGVLWTRERELRERYCLKRPYCGAYFAKSYIGPGTQSYLLAAFRGMISREAMYEFLFREENMENTVRTITQLAVGIREQGRHVAKRGSFSLWGWRAQKNELACLLGRELDNGQTNSTVNAGQKQKEEFTAEEQELLAFVDNVYETVINIILEKELRRGDSETSYSRYVRYISRIYGVDNLIAILAAMGKDKLERSTYYKSESKKGCLSHLLSVCIPYDADNADGLREKLKATDITERRLIEASLYSPEWIDIVGEYLGWEGYKSACYYFMAHMNEQFDDVRKAVIARYTPLTEEELNLGAFDISWFRSAYETLGKKRFEIIYDAAKYISDGSKHSRARKYADAVLGNLKKAEVENTIRDKRNKDLVMAYGLIPLAGDDDMFSRYLFLQDFLKGSKKFGAQRIASEKAAVGIAMSNLAMNAGYSDVTRLTLRMETKLIDDVRDLFEEKEVGDVTVRLLVDETGRTEILCVKNGKTLKSVPAKLKKDAHIVLLNETKKRLTDQYKRTKLMFEQAMEDETEFTVSEIQMLHDNPVAYPVVKDLLFISDGRVGFLSGSQLTDYKGGKLDVSDDTVVRVAHPFHIYQDGHWSQYQQYMFDHRLKQSFKQVFRELYVKTEEELAMEYSRRYSGNQIQPKKTVACLKQRRWVADIDSGLQKVYYKENIVARIYALADWFSPADIEAPTLEWVEFSDRKTGERIRIEKIPDVIFSEVMRDLDLAVSVAHAGGVDPETSHSTVEMRAALLTFTLPLFQLDNVRINKNHAVIDGHYGTYTVNLGSGVIHKQGGTMISVLPVHSQHRGKIFLPFADDDPKTAEILTKVILFAEDKKIKDPTILQQIR